MTCHNQRVTRSRRHAEAKRNKTTAHPHSGKKDKERDKDRAGNSSTHRSKSKTSLSNNTLKSPQINSSIPNPSNLSASSIDHSQAASNLSTPNHSVSILPASPHTLYQPGKSATSLNSLAKSRSPDSLGSGFPLGKSTSSDRSHPKLQSSKSTSNMLGRRRGDSASLVHDLGLNQDLPENRAGSHYPSDFTLTDSHRPSFHRSSSADAKGLLPNHLRLQHPNSGLNRFYDSSPHLNSSVNSSQSYETSIQEISLLSQINQPQPFDPNVQSTEAKNKIKHRSASLDSSAVNLQLSLASNDQPTAATANHTTFSYGDIFSSLDCNGISTPLMSSSYLDDPHRVFGMHDSSVTDHENMAASDFDHDAASRRDGSEEVSELVRRSIRLSRHAPNSSDLGLDVGLVERLLWDLDETKERMKNLQEEYSKMMRATAAPSDGPSVEGYAHQAEREDAESRMRHLKSKMIEQASRLKEMDSMKTLEKKSEELQHSVTGLQNHLSQLVAERDFRVAEVEALTDIGDAAKKGEQILQTREGLSERFDQIRDRYLREIQELAAERDKLKEEVAHLTKVRDSQAKELDSLNSRSDALTEMNAQAVRQLEKTRGNVARIHGRPPPPSTKAASQSPTTGYSNQEVDYHIQMSPEVNIATTRKFKWGKSHAQKASAARHHGAHHAKNLSSTSGPESLVAHHVNNSSNLNGLTDVNGNPNLSNNSSTVGSNNPGGGPGPNPPAVSSNSSHAISSSIVGLRPHNFQPVSVLRPVRCDYCGDKLWGLAEVRCSVCGSYCHTKCTANFFGCQAPPGSNHALANPSSGSNEDEVESVIFGNDLITQAKQENKLVPSVVTKCIEAVDQNGLNFEGIYRKTGGMSSVKMIQTCFETGTSMNLSDLNKFNDISAITSTLKNYFRQLPNPLFTLELHEAFVAVATMLPDLVRLEALERVLYQLPPVHFETLKVLMTHLSKIEKLSEFNKMTPSNLGVIFGPTLMRSSNPNRQFSDMPFTAKIVELTVLNRSQLFKKPYPHPNQPSSSSASHAPTTTVKHANHGSGSGSLSNSLTSTSLIHNSIINTHSNLMNSSSSNPSLNHNHNLPVHGNVSNSNSSHANPTNLPSSASHPNLTT